jgi:hypothetical protein
MDPSGHQASYNASESEGESVKRMKEEEKQEGFRRHDNFANPSLIISSSALELEQPHNEQISLYVVESPSLSKASILREEESMNDDLLRSPSVDKGLRKVSEDGIRSSLSYSQRTWDDNEGMKSFSTKVSKSQC